MLIFGFISLTLVPILALPVVHLSHFFVRVAHDFNRNLTCHHIITKTSNVFFFLKDHSNQAFFAVYDGHSGVDASNYAATHLHCHLARNKCLEKDPLLALKEAFEKTDKCFVAKAKREVRSNIICFI